MSGLHSSKTSTVTVHAEIRHKSELVNSNRTRNSGYRAFLTFFRGVDLHLSGRQLATL